MQKHTTLKITQHTVMKTEIYHMITTGMPASRLRPLKWVIWKSETAYFSIQHPTHGVKFA